MHATDIGKRIGELLEEADMSPEALGRQLGYSGRQVSRWIKAESPAPLAARARIADLFGVGRDELDAASFRDVAPGMMSSAEPPWVAQRFEHLEAALRNANEKLDQLLAAQ